MYYLPDIHILFHSMNFDANVVVRVVHTHIFSFSSLPSTHTSIKEERKHSEKVCEQGTFHKRKKQYYK